MWSSLLVNAMIVTVVRAAGPVPVTVDYVWPLPTSHYHSLQIYKYEDILSETKLTKPSNCYLLDEALKRFNETMNILQDIIEKKQTYEQKTGKVDEIREIRVQEAPPVKKSMSCRECSETNSCDKKETKNDLEQKKDAKIYKKLPKLRGMKIKMRNPCEESNYPYLKMAETYSINVLKDRVVYLKAESIWGIIRALETLTQLFYFNEDYTDILIRQQFLNDGPKYAHRGLLLDTARHYIPVADILRILDGMAINKLNVFHWHIVNDHSFPYQSQVLPELSEKAAYHPKLVYTSHDISRVVESARLRGIRVIPELGFPEHLDSLAASHPEVMMETNGKLYLDVLGNKTIDLLHTLYQEMIALFPDDYVYIDSLNDFNEDGWDWGFFNSRMVSRHLKDLNLSESDVMTAFYENVLSVFPENKKLIISERVNKQIKRSTNSKLLKNAAVQVYRTDDHSVAGILNAGRCLIFSKGYDLKDFFVEIMEKDPSQNVFQYIYNEKNIAVLLNYVLGGELTVWTNNIDQTNLQTSVWLQAMALAETLWPVQRDPGLSPQRLQQQLCRMRQRDLRSYTFGPTLCVTKELFQVGVNDAVGEFW